MNIEDYVNFEIAKSLKQKGFNWGCISYYEHFSSNVTLYSGMVPEWSDSYIDHNKIESRYSRPTLQMAMKWLREVHKLWITITFHWHTVDGETTLYYSPYIMLSEYKNVVLEDKNSFKTKLFSTYEQACEAAIKYCLEKLVV